MGTKMSGSVRAMGWWRRGQLGGRWGGRGYTLVDLCCVMCILLIGLGIACAVWGFGRPSAPVAKGERRIGAMVSAGAGVSGTGRITESAFQALQAAGRPMASMLDLSTNSRFRSLEISVASTAAATSSGAINVYKVKRGAAPAGGVPDYVVRYSGQIGYVIGSTTGAAPGATVDITERLASTLTWTPANDGTSPPGIDTYLTNAFGSNGVVRFSPADGVTPALIQFTDVGNAEWVLFDPLTTAGATVVIVGEQGT